jgi:hypothetical protein
METEAYTYGDNILKMLHYRQNYAVMHKKKLISLAQEDLQTYRSHETLKVI